MPAFFKIIKSDDCRHPGRNHQEHQVPAKTAGFMVHYRDAKDAEIHLKEFAAAINLGVLGVLVVWSHRENLT
jgi:hypothetical protein